MSKDTITLVMDGEIYLPDFSKAINGLLSLVKALENDVDRSGKIKWIIDELNAGSATASVRGLPETDEYYSNVEKIVTAYGEVGKAIQKNDVQCYTPAIRKAAKEIVEIINGNVRSIRFETAEIDVDIYKNTADFITAKQESIKPEYGSVTGRVSTLHKRNQLRFTLYDSIEDKGISCYLEEGSEDIMKEAWGKLAIVEGLIRRDPISGKPTTVRKVQSVNIIQDMEPGGWRDAIGADPRGPNDLLPEEAIRKIRDEW